MAPTPHVQRGPGFHPETPHCKNMVALNDALSGGNDARRTPSPLSPNSEGFRPEPHHACRTLLTKTVARSPPQPQHLSREKLSTAGGTTTTPPTNTCSPRPHHLGGAGPASLSRGRKGAPTTLLKHPLPVHRTPPAHHLQATTAQVKQQPRSPRPRPSPASRTSQSRRRPAPSLRAPTPAAVAATMPTAAAARAIRTGHGHHLRHERRPPPPPCTVARPS